ncbi:hypothetical protein CPB85DRAFT_1292612 [Mucidula mucida]|nr:hypothetical protein CPB85DRAFT_1292612 [Mucidula mucida]
MTNPTLLSFISAHETLLKVTLGCLIPITVLLCFAALYFSCAARSNSIVGSDLERATVKSDGVTSAVKIRVLTGSEAPTALKIDPNASEKNAVAKSATIDYGTATFSEKDARRISSLASSKLIKYAFPSMPTKSYPAKRTHISVSDPLPCRESLSWWQVCDLAVDSYPPSPPSPTPSSPRSSPYRPDPAPPLYADTIIPYQHLKQLSGGRNSVACGYQSKPRPITPPSSSLPTPPATPPLCIVKKCATISSRNLVSDSPKSLRVPPSLCPLSRSPSPLSIHLEEDKENIDFQTNGRVAHAIEEKVLSLRDSSPRKNRSLSSPNLTVDSWSPKSLTGRSSSSDCLRPKSPTPDTWSPKLEALKYDSWSPRVCATLKPDSWDIFKNRAATRKHLGLPCLVKVDGDASLDVIAE